jgi:hypothetical protein
MAALSTNDLLLGIGLVLALAVGSHEESGSPTPALIAPPQPSAA